MNGRTHHPAPKCHCRVVLSRRARPRAGQPGNQTKRKGNPGGGLQDTQALAETHHLNLALSKKQKKQNE
jgi:hypothetical protein